MSKYIDTPAIIQVIGSVFKDPSLLDDNRYSFNETDFPERFHKVLFGTIYNLHILGAKKIDINAIEDYLAQRPKSYAIYKTNKGHEYLQEILDKNMITAFDYYYNRVKKMSLFRAYSEIGLDLSWIYDIDNIFDAQKKQEQEDFIDNHSLVELADMIDNKISSIKNGILDNVNHKSMQAGDGIFDLLTKLKEEPAIGYPLYGPLINAVTRGARLKKFYLRSAPTGVGKAIPNDTKIPTPQGWRRVDEIKVGDYLFGDDGEPVRVKQVFPQPKKKEIYQVIFSDGRVANCCGEHLWEYQYKGHSKWESRVETTKQIIQRSEGSFTQPSGGFKYRIKVNQPVKYPERNFSISPYVMGLLLGDGSFRYTNNNKELSFSSQDEELPKAIAQYFQCSYKKSSEHNYNYTFGEKGHNLWVEDILKDYPALWNAKSETKFIPIDFLMGSVEQRLDLLKGLLDTDGSIDTKGRVTYTTVSPQMRDGIIELCHSLGFLTSYSVDKRDYKYTTGECYTIHIQCAKEKKPMLFSLTRKVQIATAYAASRKRAEGKDYIAITDIQPIGRYTDMTCFTVDNDSHLFLMNDFIVTHNTRSMIADACNFACNKIYKDGKWVPNGTKEPTLYITTEQEKDEIQTMMMAFLADVDEDHIVRHEYDMGEEKRVYEAANIIADSPIYIVTLPNFTMKDIENSIKAEIREHNVKYICHDYIHSSMAILGEISSQSGVKGLREDNILFMISTRLKDICNEYGVFIISSTQLNGNYQDAKVYDQNLLRGRLTVVP